MFFSSIEKEHPHPISAYMHNRFIYTKQYKKIVVKVKPGCTLQYIHEIENKS